MAVSTEKNKQAFIVYSGTGVTYDWTDFVVDADADLEVYAVFPSDPTDAVATAGQGARVQLTLTTHFTVASNTPSGGGSVTITATGNTLITGDSNYVSNATTRIAIYRRVAELLQPNSYNSQGAFLSATIEDSFDNIYFILQQHKERLDRTIQIDPWDTVLDGLADDAARQAAVRLNNLSAGADGVVYWDPTNSTFAISSDVSTADLISVADNIASIVAVNANEANINTVAGISANINTVAGSIANVNTVAESISNVTTVAGSIANVNTVAADLNGPNTIGAAVASAAAAAASAGAAATSESNAASSASSASSSAAAAAASAASAAASANELGVVDDYTALKALAGGVNSAVQVEDAARGGMFIWRSGDQSASVTADPSEGIYVPPSSDVTGASGVWARNVADGRYNGKWFGIVADGSTDIAAKLQDAIDLADTNSIGVVFLPREASDYAWNTQVTGTEGVALELYGDYLIGTAANTPSYLVSGSEGSAVSVTATATKGDTSVTVGAGDESGFTAGGWARIYATDVIDSQRTSTKVAELVRVESTASGSIVLDQSLEFTYTTTPFIVPVTLVQNPILRGDFRVYATGAADNDLYFARFLLCEAVRCSGFEAERIDDRAVGVEDCVGALVENWTCKNTETSGFGYGVSIIGSTKGARIFNWEATDVRHAISTNNSSTRGGAPEVRAGFGVIFASPLTNPGGAETSPLDTHAACTSVHYHDITIYGSSGDAVNIEAANVLCERIKVVGAGRAGIRAYHYSDQDGSYTFRDIEVDGAAEEALAVRSVTSAGTLHRVHVDGFKATNCNGTGENVFEIGFVPSNVIGEVVLENVIVSGCANVSAHAMYLDEISRVSLNNVRVDEYDNTGIRLRDIDYCDINGFVFSAASGNCEALYLDDNVDNFFIRNSLLDGRSISGADGILVDSLVGLAVIDPSVVFLNNTADFTGSTSIPIRGYVDKDGNQVVGDRQSGTGETVGFTAGAGTSVLDDSTFTGNVGATAYRISDIVKALKNHGLLAS